MGGVYSLDYEACTFDVVHAHQVLQHLSDPVAALREMGRVCQPDGLVALRDSDYAGFTWYPAVPELDEWLQLYREVARGNGAEQDAGRRLKSWALAAGLDVVSSTLGVWCFSSSDDVAWWGGMWAERGRRLRHDGAGHGAGTGERCGPGTAGAGLAALGCVSTRMVRRPPRGADLLPEIRGLTPAIQRGRQGPVRPPSRGPCATSDARISTGPSFAIGGN